LTYSFWLHYGLGVDSAFEYQEYILGGKCDHGLGLTTIPHSCADCLKLWESQPPVALRACPGL